MNIELLFSPVLLNVVLSAILICLQKIYVIMEYCEGGNLYDSIIRGKVFAEREVAKICKAVASVLLFCHNNLIMHRDLKPENILIASRHDDTDVRLADFGSATHFKPGNHFIHLLDMRNPNIVHETLNC